MTRIDQGYQTTVAFFRILALFCIVGCASDYSAPSLDDCERAGGVLIATGSDYGVKICIRREALIDARRVGR